MKARAELKSKGPRRVNPQQVVYELKHRVVVALNKIADRDTYQIGVEELEKTAESLNPDGIIPFLSCILDTDSEQKNAVRKECVRMMGLMAKFHGGLVEPHLGKMVASIVKRLKDQDSVVRDTCIETMGVLASEFGNNSVENDGVFVLLVRPLFEALGEQNKQIQSGAAMCLARVIDNMNDPPVSILQKMLARTMKLLKSPHFMAKPAVIELNKSLIQAGGALSHGALYTAISNIQEGLKNSDWTTRKSAASALGEIGSSGGTFLAPFKASCIQALESCRFDKVKPVRDTISQALGYWRSIPEHHVVKPLGTVPSVKDTLSRDEYSDLISAGSSISKDVSHKELKSSLMMKRALPSGRKGSQNYAEKCNNSNSDWHIEVAVPKTHNSIPQCFQIDESESSSATKILEAVTADVISERDIGHEYDLMDEKQEYSSSSNHVSDNFSNKMFMAAAHCPSQRGDLKLTGGEMQVYMSRRTDRTSLDSTLTYTEESQPVCVSCSAPENDISSIRNQLMEIEKKQSSLMDLLQAFTSSTMESLSVIQLKVSSLEHAIDKITHDVHGSKHADLASMKFVTKCQSVASPGISSTCTPRSSIDLHDKKSSVRSTRNNEVFDGKEVGMKCKSNSISSYLDYQRHRQPLSMMNRSFRARENDRVFDSDLKANGRQNGKVSDNDIREHIKALLCEGDLDSAYREALNLGNQLVLAELIDRTGPVLDSLSNKTISDLFTALASGLFEHRIVESVIPWLQQIVDLSAIHGPNYIPLPLKVRRQIISVVQEALDVEVTHPTKRRLIAQLAMKLQQIWGKCP